MVFSYAKDINTFRDLKGPIIDVRSPDEYSKGHWPGAINLPLFGNEERSIIGKTYKHKGREAAIAKGLELITPKLADFQVKLYKLYLSQINTDLNYCLRIYCWRGGMRSASICWLSRKTKHMKTFTLLGGYKVYRSWVLSQFKKKWSINLIGGKTGTAKTEILSKLKEYDASTIDLEGLANHKGSSFGGLGLAPQPSTEHFENKIAENLNQFEIKNSSIWIEAESGSLGKCRLPKDLYDQMKTAPIYEIIKTKYERINNLVKTYSIHSKEDLINSTKRISKRLGPNRTKTAIEAIKNQNWEIACSEILDYYDRCYEYELNERSNRTKVDLKGISNSEAAKKLLSL